MSEKRSRTGSWTPCSSRSFASSYRSSSRSGCSASGRTTTRPRVLAIRASAPDLDRARLRAEAGPVRWTGHALAFELALELRDTGVEIRRALHRPALPRCPGADLAPARARGEVRGRVDIGHRRDAPLDSHLAFERRPVKAHR